ncbi:hypothetical protein pb186bvf_010909 [Paramecium bursaria]
MLIRILYNFNYQQELQKFIKKWSHIFLFHFNEVSSSITCVLQNSNCNKRDFLLIKFKCINRIINDIYTIILFIMKNLLSWCRENQLILFLTISTIIWIGLQAAQIELQNQFQTEQIRQMLINNWNKQPIIGFNISKECLETESNVNYTIPYQNSQCLCQEGIYNQECSQDQDERQGCSQIQEFNSQNINYWPFYLRLTSQVPCKLCQQQSEHTYYKLLQQNKCFNNYITQEPISNISINRSYMVNEYMLVRDSIQIEKSTNDPIVGIYIQTQINSQIQNNFKKQTIIEALTSQEVWNVNNVSSQNQYHPHIIHNYTYYLVAEKYIKLKDKCDCSNQFLNTLDQLVQLEQLIVWMPYLQLAFIFIFMLVIIILSLKPDKIYILSIITIIFEFEFVLLLIYYFYYHQGIIQLNDCFNFIIMGDAFSIKLLSIQITIIILIFFAFVISITMQVRQRKKVYQLEQEKQEKNNNTELFNINNFVQELITPQQEGQQI